MSRATTLNALAAVLVLSLSSACGDTEGDEPTGTAPTITELSFSPSDATAGEMTEVSGTIHFEDPDADVRQLVLELSDSLGNTQRLPELDIANAGAFAAGEVAFQLFVRPAGPGTLTLEAWCIDGLGLSSNRLSGDLMVSQ